MLCRINTKCFRLAACVYKNTSKVKTFSTCFGLWPTWVCFTFFEVEGVFFEVYFLKWKVYFSKCTFRSRNCIFRSVFFEEESVFFEVEKCKLEISEVFISWRFRQRTVGWGKRLHCASNFQKRFTNHCKNHFCHFIHWNFLHT